jgi:hypothetical protein
MSTMFSKIAEREILGLIISKVSTDSIFLLCNELKVFTYFLSDNYYKFEYKWILKHLRKKYMSLKKD